MTTDVRLTPAGSRAAVCRWGGWSLPCRRKSTAASGTCTQHVGSRQSTEPGALGNDGRNTRRPLCRKRCSVLCLVQGAFPYQLGQMVPRHPLSSQTASFGQTRPANCHRHTRKWLQQGLPIAFVAVALRTSLERQNAAASLIEEMHNSATPVAGADLYWIQKGARHGKVTGMQFTGEELGHAPVQARALRLLRTRKLRCQEACSSPRCR